MSLQEMRYNKVVPSCPVLRADWKAERIGLSSGRRLSVRKSRREGAGAESAREGSQCNTLQGDTKTPRLFSSPTRDRYQYINFYRGSRDAAETIKSHERHGHTRRRVSYGNITMRLDTIYGL